MLEDLNTVHGLKKEIERLRAGEEQDRTDEAVRLTPGQWWKRLLDMNEKNRMKYLSLLVERADSGVACAEQAHAENLSDLRQHAVAMTQRGQGWKRSHRLLSIYVTTLRRSTEPIGRAEVADKLELFLSPGADPDENKARRILCGYRWTELGRAFECAEPVGPDGFHPGDHYAYVREGASADEELRMRYLEEENDALRARLGLPGNPPRGK